MKWDVPAELSIGEMIEIRDGLKSGDISLTFSSDVQVTDEIEQWRLIVTNQLIAEYDRQIRARAS